MSEFTPFSDSRVRGSAAQSLTISAVLRSRKETTKGELGPRKSASGLEQKTPSLNAAVTGARAQRSLDDYRSVGCGNEALCLGKSCLTDRGKIQQSGELFRELLDEVNFAIKREGLGGKSTMFNSRSARWVRSVAKAADRWSTPITVPRSASPATMGERRTESKASHGSSPNSTLPADRQCTCRRQRAEQRREHCLLVDLWA